MRNFGQCTILRSLTWLAFVLAMAASADLVEDALFEVDEASAAEEEVQVGAADDVTVPSPRLAGLRPPAHPVLLPPADAVAAGVIGAAQADLPGGSVRIHGPPSVAPPRSILTALPLRI